MSTIFNIKKEVFAAETDGRLIKLMYGKGGRADYGFEEYKDSEGLKDTLSTFIKTNKIRTRYVSLILNNRETVLKCVALNAPPNEIGQVLRYDLKSFILIDTNEYIVDYKITRVVEGKTHILIAAVPKSVVCKYIAVFNKVNVTVANVDVYQNRIAKAFSADGNILVISESGKRIQLIFSDGGVLTGSREMPFLDETSVISEISKLFDSFLTHNNFESVIVLSKNLRFLVEHLNSQGIACRSLEKMDFLALNYLTLPNIELKG